MPSTPVHARQRRLLPAADRHLAGRFSYGITADLASEVRGAGGAERWFDEQLQPARIRDRSADELRGWWPSLDRSCTSLWQRQRDGIEGGWEVMQDYQRWVLLRRMTSRRQVLEAVTELWENHFNVPVTGDAQCFWRTDYGDAIRAHALGRFEDLLQAVAVHPAMLINLDNVSSSAAHPNENLGRELLELHTVGRGEYDEDDVKDSARILTGWSVEMWTTFRATYRSDWHARGPVRVMGFKSPNRQADGRDVTRAYLRYLARHPATARRVARKLAVKFVRDDPPADLVERLARVYLENDTAIRPVLRALVRSRAFADAVGAKVRDPGEDLVASYRALGIRVTKPRSEEAAANALLWQASTLGTKPFDWPRPDGQPIDNDSWASPSRMLASMNVHWVLAGTWWPKEDVRYRSPESWVPRFPIRFDDLVDHLSRVLLHRRASASLLQACCEAVGVPANERITADHGLIRWNMYRLLSTFLDSPAFLTR